MNRLQKNSLHMHISVYIPTPAEQKRSCFSNYDVKRKPSATDAKIFLKNTTSSTEMSHLLG